MGSPAEIVDTLVVLPALADVVDELLHRSGSLSTSQKATLDALGNKDGLFNLGDLLALLDWMRENYSATQSKHALPPPASMDDSRDTVIGGRERRENWRP